MNQKEVMDNTQGLYTIGITRKVNLGNYENVDIFANATIPYDFDNHTFEEFLKEWNKKFDRLYAEIEGKVNILKANGNDKPQEYQVDIKQPLMEDTHLSSDPIDNNLDDNLFD